MGNQTLDQRHRRNLKQKKVLGREVIKEVDSKGYRKIIKIGIIFHQSQLKTRNVGFFDVTSSDGYPFFSRPINPKNYE